MKLIPLLCPRCGADIQINQELESGSCMYCGTVFKVRDEVTKVKVEHSGSIKIDHSDSVSNFIELAHLAYNAGNYNEALRYCVKILEINPKNHIAWIIKTKVHAINSAKGKIQYSEAMVALEQGLNNAPDSLKEGLANELVNDISESLFYSLKYAGTVYPIWDLAYQKNTTVTRKNKDLNLQETITKSCINTWFQLLGVPYLTQNTYKKQIDNCKFLSSNYQTRSLMKMAGKSGGYTKAMKEIAALKYPEYKEEMNKVKQNRKEIYTYIAMIFVPYFTFFYLLIKKPFEEKKNKTSLIICGVWTIILIANSLITKQ